MKMLKKIGAGIITSLVIFSLVVAPAAPAFALWGEGDETQDPAHLGVTSTNTAFQGTNTATTIKDLAISLGKAVLMGIASALLNKLTEATVNWINGGFQGSPQFVEHPKAFFKDVGDVGVKTLVDTIGYDDGKYPYGRAVAKSLVHNYLYEEGNFQDKFQFTLDKVVGNDWKNFQTDFKVGGWSGYDAYVGNPANNSFSFAFAGIEEIHKKNLAAKEDLKTELDRGQGFMNQKICTEKRSGPQMRQTSEQASDAVGEDIENSYGQGSSGYNSNNSPDLPGYDPDAPTITEDTAPQGGSTGGGSGSTSGGGTSGANNNGAGAGTYGANYPGGSGTGGGDTPGSADHEASDGHYYNQNTNSEYITGIDDQDCTKYETISPGSIVKSQISRALEGTFAKGELAGALGNSISAILNALFSSLINKGLSALSTAISGDGDKGPDTWSYDGVTLSAGLEQFNSNNPSGWASGPDRIYDLVELLITGPEIVTPNPNGGEPIITHDESKTVIATTEKELGYYKDMAALSDQLPFLLMNLDHCLPGLDAGWQSKIRSQFQRTIKKLNRKLQTKKNENAQKKLEKAIREIENAGEKLVRTIEAKQLEHNIPDAILMQDQVTRASRFSQQSKQNFDKILEKTTTVARLKALKKQLQTLGPIDQLDTLDLDGQATLGLIVKQYSAMENDVTNDSSLSRAETEYTRLNADVQKIKDYMDPALPDSCPTEKMDPKNQILFVYKVENKAAKILEVFSKIGAGVMLVLTGGLSATIPGMTTPFGMSGTEFGELLDTVIPPGYKVGNAFGSAVIYDIPAAPSPELAHIAIIPDVSREDMVAAIIADPFLATADDQQRLGALEDEEVRIAYSIVLGNASHSYITNTNDGPELVTKALDFLDSVSNPGGTRRVIADAETMFYCQEELDKVDTTNVYKQMDINIACPDFYHSELYDYEINKSY